MVGSMTPSLVAIFLLGFSSLATAANFNQVYQWNELDFEWPSEESRAQALKNETFKLENIYPRYMAVYGTRIFLSTYHSYANPVSLVSLPMSSAFSASPKLTPVPSWDMHGKEGDCDKIERAKGIDVDSVGRLWLLDRGGFKCNIVKLWTIDLANNDQTKLIHQFPFHSLMHDLVVDETANETFVYISRGGLFYEEQIVVFSLERNESWIVQTPGIKVFCIALSPLKDQEPRQLYLGEWSSSDLHSINSVAVLREGTGTANTEKIGALTAHPYRILVENNGNMLAAFFSVNYISSWNTSQSFAEKRFHEVDVLNSGKSFTFALDQNGTLWMTVFDAVREPKYRLLKAAVGEQSLQATPTPELHVATAASGGVQSRILVNSSLFFVFLLALALF